MKEYFVTLESEKWSHVIYVDERWPHLIPKDEIDRRMNQFITKYVRVNPERLPVLIDFVWQTWRCPADGPWPNLRIVGAVGCGKTTLMEVIGLLCFRPCVAPPFTPLDEVRKWCDTGTGFETLLVDEAKKQKHVRKTLPGARVVVDRKGFAPPPGGWTHEIAMAKVPDFMSMYWYEADAVRREAIDIQSMIGTYLEANDAGDH